MPLSTRNKNATWRSLGTLCRKRDWSKPRVLYELQNGLRYRTIPPWHEKIDWHDPIMQHRLNVEASEMTMMGLDFVTLGIEVLDEPADVEAPLPSVDAPATVPAPLRVSSKDIRDCILAIQKERPNDPPGRDELWQEVENRLNWPVGRDRMEKLRKKVAPQWVKPKGRPRKSAQ